MTPIPPAPSIEALIENIRSRSPSVPQSPTNAPQNSPFVSAAGVAGTAAVASDPQQTTTLKAAQLRLMQNQKAREDFLFGKGATAEKGGECLIFYFFTALHLPLCLCKDYQAKFDYIYKN